MSEHKDSPTPKPSPGGEKATGAASGVFPALLTVLHAMLSRQGWPRPPHWDYLERCLQSLESPDKPELPAPMEPVLDALRHIAGILEAMGYDEKDIRSGKSDAEILSLVAYVVSRSGSGTSGPNEPMVAPTLPSSEVQQLVAGSFWTGLTFEELAIAQGHGEVPSFDSYLGGWPEDEIDDGFEDAVRRWRDEDIARD